MLFSFMKATIDRLQQKVEKLVERYRASETTNLSLNQQLSSLQLQLEENRNRISDLKEKQNFEAFGISSRKRRRYQSNKATN